MEAGESVPQSTTVFEPGVSSSYGNGWKQLWKYFLELFLIGIIYFVISLPGGMGSWTYNTVYNIWDLIGMAYGILISGPVGYGVAFAYLKAARGEAPEIKNTFEAFKNYWNAVLAYLLVAVIVIIGFLLLIIPGIIFACKLAFVPYIVVERKMDAISAVKESWQLTSGYAIDVFLIGLLGIPIAIAGLICFGVGVIVSIMWISLATASLYHAVCLKYRISPQRPA